MEQLVTLFKPLERPQQESVNSDHFTIFGPMGTKVIELKIILRIKKYFKKLQI
jgi:hypothetical protein